MASLRPLVLLALLIVTLAPAAAFGQSYRNYTQIAQLLADAETAYPAICRRVNLGNSVQARPIWALNISDNVGVQEDEPEFKYISTMHGNEWTGNEMMLYLIDELLGEYANDVQVTNLVNELDVWIIPVMNPDGFAVPQRWNASGVDLNRDFPDRIIDAVNTTAGRAAETAVIMNWSFANSFTLSANFHTGALVANYPYDGNTSGNDVYTPCPDDALFIYISEQYSQHNLPMWNSGEFFHGITNGADWYVIYGGMQDWNYHWMGCNEITVELSEAYQPSAAQIPTFWSQNRDSLLAYMDTALIGVRGLVTDSVTGEPLAATVSVAGNAHNVFTDPDIGDYHRMLLPGTYNLMFSSPGYPSKTIKNVAVTSGAATRLDVTLLGAPVIEAGVLPEGAAYVEYEPHSFAVIGGAPPLTWTLGSVPTYAEADLGAGGLAETGVAQNLHGDDTFRNYTLPFAFPFYGASYTAVQIWSNGFINFGNISGSSYSNTNALLIGNRRIAPLWDDLTTSNAADDIFIDESVAGEVTIRWKARTHTGGHLVSFAVTLREDGGIEFHYGSGNSPVSPTIGISNGDGIGYLLATHNGSTSLTNANAIEFTSSSLLPAGLSISAAGSLQGTPQEWGSYAFNVRVTDDIGRTDVAGFSLTIVPPSATGDYNGDSRVDLNDFAAFQACNGSAPAGACGAAFEYVPNGMIDLEDFAVFTEQITGPAN